jgi:hypothetical protein
MAFLGESQGEIKGFLKGKNKITKFTFHVGWNSLFTPLYAGKILFFVLSIESVTGGVCSAEFTAA